jgi:hypothetical protein
MSTEYSRSVDWSEEYEQWENIGEQVMRQYYEDNPQAAADDYGYELDEDGKLDEDVLYELADHQAPMMNYAYPLRCEPSDDKVLRVCRETNLTVMYHTEEDEYYLALTGGGMDLSQDIARAYQILENWLPLSLLPNVCQQPELSIHGEAWLEMAEQITKQLRNEIQNLARDLKQWRVNIREYQLKHKEV